MGVKAEKTTRVNKRQKRMLAKPRKAIGHHYVLAYYFSVVGHHSFCLPQVCAPLFFQLLSPKHIWNVINRTREEVVRADVFFTLNIQKQHLLSCAIHSSTSKGIKKERPTSFSRCQHSQQRPSRKLVSGPHSCKSSISYQQLSTVSWHPVFPGSLIRSH